MVRRLSGQVSYEVSNKLEFAEHQKGLVFVTGEAKPLWSLMKDGMMCVGILSPEIPLGRWASPFHP